MHLAVFGANVFFMDQHLVGTDIPMDDGFSHILPSLDVDTELAHPPVSPPSTILGKRKRSSFSHQFSDFLHGITDKYVSKANGLVELQSSSGPIVDWSCRSCNMLQEELDEACQVIARDEDILVVVNRKESKFYDGLVSLHDRYLYAEVNLCGAEGTKSAGEEIFLEAVKYHAEMRDRFCTTSERISFLENQRSLLEVNYEAGLR
ncbi:unnamed protein product [Lactuca virosa]|uniref:Uncharacterized protein n=1 Tax=Lactuca virosa TaxID=75947 RepID=A0AAU9PRJ8_9ASTR|nr:unnamed protein product [Lactuca virosa]